MTLVLLDTNICIYLMEGRAASAAARLEASNPDTVGIPMIVAAELRYAAAHSLRKDANTQRLDRFLSQLQLFPFEERGTHTYAELKDTLVRAGTPIGPMDMLIAATALANDAILVTNNVREFSRVPGLRVENWSEPPRA